MPRFTVVWAADVQDESINQWIGGTSSVRQRLTDIANTIDKELSRPELLGEVAAVDSNLRLWNLPDFTPTVSVAFEILAEDRLVRVLRISVKKPQP